jgi:hypothetical protein
MTNMSLISQVVELVNEYFAAECISVNDNSIYENAMDWYTHTDIVDAEILASAVIEFGPYQHTTLTVLEQYKEYYFPTMPIELCNFHIGEIEEALLDAQWRE